MNEQSEALLRAKLNQETARLAWREMERFFAAGTLVTVAAGLDLVEVAAQVANDNAAQVKEWMESGLVQRPSDDQARAWAAGNAELWAVVVKPWVLVQEKRDPRLH